MGRYIEFQIPLIGVTVNSLVVENTSTNNYFVVANASMTDENLYGVVQFPQVGRNEAEIVQLEERQIPNLIVGGSSPSLRAY